MNYETAVRALRDIVYHEAVRMPHLENLPVKTCAEKGLSDFLGVSSLIVVTGTLGSGHTMAVRDAIQEFALTSMTLTAKHAITAQKTTMVSLQPKEGTSSKSVLVLDCFPGMTNREQQDIKDMMTRPGAENILFIIVTGERGEAKKHILPERHWRINFPLPDIN